MVKHIVCFLLKDKSKKEETRKMLLSMRGVVPEIKNIEVGADFLQSARSYDVILMVDVEDRAALDAYQNNAYHVNVVKPFMHEAREASVAVDYEY